MNPDEKDIKLFIETIKNKSDYDFSEYTMNSLKRRIQKLLADNKTDIHHLILKIKNDQQFLEKLIKKITVHTTELFRDPFVWKNLKNQILPGFTDKSKISIWHAGCSTGQEVYSMIILLNEAGLLEKSEILATDINTDVLDIAKKGIYKYLFNQEYLKNFDEVINDKKENNDRIPYTGYLDIDEKRDTLCIKKQFTEKPVFRKVDLVKNELIFNGSFDLIICRNVIIYFNSELQNKVIQMFHEHMTTGSCLVLGKHESIMDPYSNYFDKKQHIYIKKTCNKLNPELRD